MINISHESVVNIGEERFSLMFTAHKEEVGVCQDFELDPDFEMFYHLESAGVFFFFVARTEEGEPVGYVYYTTHTLPHYKSVKSATMGAIFVDKEYRKDGVGSDLIKYAEDYLIDEGCTFFDIRMKVYAPFETLAEDLGYEKMEYLYTKRV